MKASTFTRRPLQNTALVCCGLAAAATMGLTGCEGFSPNQKPMGQYSTAARIATSTTKTSMSSIEEDLQRRRTLEEETSSNINNGPLLGDLEERFPPPPVHNSNNEPLSLWKDLSSQFETMMPGGSKFKLPPIQIDDTNLLLYDVFLLLNLVVSISFWVVHRMQLDFIALAFNEGCLLSILWIMAGLYHGAFLDSAKDGHQRPAYYIGEDDETEEESKQATTKPFWELPPLTQGGPSAAGLLAVNTFINTISLRLIVALVVAVVQHRPVFDDPLEQLIPYEVGFGLVLMSVWRTIHSAYTPRV